ncbi:MULTISPECIES: hypothetical protein [Glutamicibacter]|uniref:hypothetical protein n=1 Tax=Glutamicibacter TaxID=1742989 RepID=UPI00257ECE3A|nr:hypothetical protein [Glutamicibacter sp.]
MIKKTVVNRFVEGTVNAFGVRVTVRVTPELDSSDMIATRMLTRLTKAWSDSPEPVTCLREQPLVELGDVTESNFEQIHSAMSTNVTLAALKFHAGTSLMLHAGGIAREDGRVAVIIGPSGRGKTTTVRHLGQHFGYVSDETITITPTGEILPYRKPLSVVTEGHTHKLQISPSDLGLLPLPEAKLSLGSMVLLERAMNGESESRISTMGFARGIATAIEQSSYLIELDRPLAVICAAAASVGGIRLLTVGEQSRIHEVAEQLFENAPAPRWMRVMPVSREQDSEQVAYLPAAVIDAVECEDGTVVFTESRRVIVLEGIGPQIWRAACLAENWKELVARIEQHHGQAPNGDSKATIQSVAADLLEAGVLGLPLGTEGISIHD